MGAAYEAFSRHRKNFGHRAKMSRHALGWLPCTAFAALSPSDRDAGYGAMTTPDWLAAVLSTKDYRIYAACRQMMVIAIWRDDGFARSVDDGPRATAGRNVKAARRLLFTFLRFHRRRRAADTTTTLRDCRRDMLPRQMLRLRRSAAAFHDADDDGALEQDGDFSMAFIFATPCRVSSSRPIIFDMLAFRPPHNDAVMTRGSLMLASRAP